MRIVNLLAPCLILAFTVATACDDSPPEGQPTGGAGPTGPGPAGPGSGGHGASGAAGGSGGDAGAGGMDCFTDPMTHDEIINACTDAERIDKEPVLPHLNPDGTLPPIP